MRVTSSMIDRELRITGRLIGMVNRSFSDFRLHFFYRFYNRMKRLIKVDGIQFSEVWIPRNDGKKMRICIFRPQQPKKDVPGLLWLHGGGYAFGIPEKGEKMAKAFIGVSDCIVIAPEYRLSVEAPYPAALEDGYTALLWMKNHAVELGIRSDQLMIGGNSAGGGLTAALTHYARDKKDVALAFQMPLYPMIDDRMESPSARDNNAPLWNSKSNYNAWKMYLGDLFGKDSVPYYAAPSRAADYRGLPPAATFVGDLEPFRDETIIYVEKLREAGVPVDFHVYPGCYHAFDALCPKAEVSKKAIEFLMDAYRYAVNHYFAEQKDNRHIPE